MAIFYIYSKILQFFLQHQTFLNLSLNADYCRILIKLRFNTYKSQHGL